jgi:hypothetical protein
MNRHAGKHRLPDRWAQWGCRLLITIQYLFVGTWVVGLALTLVTQHPKYFVAGMACAVVFIPLHLSWLRIVRSRAAADDPCSLELVLDAFSTPGLADKVTSSTKKHLVDTPFIRDYLIRVLPSLEPGDAFAFRAHHRLRLQSVLRGDDEPLILAVLAAVANLGDSSWIPCVRRLAYDPDAGSRPEIRNVAHRCIGKIIERMREEKLGATLLRPSSCQTPNSDLLLRPGYDTTASSGAELLRASSGDTDTV